MASKQTKQAAKTLRRLQDRQAKSVRRMGRLRGRVEKAGRKLQKLEAKAARLEARLHELRGSVPDARTLRPARLVINPNGGSFAQQVGSPEKLVAMLRAHGIQPQVHLKTSRRAVRDWVRKAVENDEALVIVAGGDGTIEEVALSLVGSRTALGIIPAGTMNNLAHALGIPLDVEQACALLGAGSIREIDVGCIEAMDRVKRTYFFETAGLGLSIAVPTGQEIKKGLWGKIPSEFRKMFDLRAAPAEIELDDGVKIEKPVKLLTISNSPLTGVNYLVAPDAKMDDGLFDVAVYDDMGDVELAEYFMGVAHGRRVSNPNVRIYRTRRVRIRLGQEMPLTSDKDELPAQQELELRVIPRALNVIAGQGSGLSWPVDAVPAVPPLVGEQAPSRDDAAADRASRSDGAGHERVESPPTGRAE